jgi:hypothetical protein
MVGGGRKIRFRPPKIRFQYTLRPARFSLSLCLPNRFLPEPRPFSYLFPTNIAAGRILHAPSSVPPAASITLSNATIFHGGLPRRGDLGARKGADEQPHTRGRELAAGEQIRARAWSLPSFPPLENRYVQGHGVFLRSRIRCRLPPSVHRQAPPCPGSEKIVGETNPQSGCEPWVAGALQGNQIGAGSSSYG